MLTRPTRDRRVGGHGWTMLPVVAVGVVVVSSSAVEGRVCSLLVVSVRPVGEVPATA